MLKDKYRINVNGAEQLINPGYLFSYKKAEQKFILTNSIEIYKNPNLIKKKGEWNRKNLYVISFWNA